MKETIRTALASSFDDAGNFDANALRRELGANNFDDEEIHALAAAIEYYDGDIEQARATIERGEYRHCPDAQDYEDLGREIFFADTEKIRYEMPSYILDYMDIEALGRDVSKDAERGQFTHFGYFAPEKW